MKTRQLHLLSRVALLLAVMLGFIMNLNAQYTAGPTLPGTGANDASYGTVAWTNPGNILTNNNVYATVTVNNSTSNYLQASNFGFSIPDGAVVLGIQVTIGRLGTTGFGQDIRDNVVSLMKNGTVVGDNKAVTGTDWGGSETAAAYGSTSDTWGETWTGADINATNFGVVLAVNSTNNRTASVDYMQITVTYSRYFQSAGTGNWNATATWQESGDGVNWIAATATPTNTNSSGIFIRNGHTVSISANVTVDEVTIDAGGQVTINSGQTLTIANGTGTDFQVSGTLLTNSISGTSGIVTTGTLAFLSGGTYQHNVDGEGIPTATWDANSLCYISNVTGSIPTGLGQNFGNFRYQAAQTGDETFGPTSIAGYLDIVSISTNAGNELRLNNNLNVGGYFNLQAGTFRITSGVNRALSVAGNVTISGGSLLMNAGTNVGTLNVAGDFTHSGGTITETSTGTGAINFNGSSMQTYTSGGTISNTINFTVNNGAYLQMAGASTTVTGGGSFTLASGGTLGINASDGIASSGATGHIRVTGTRTFNTGANYIYNGAGAQSSGTGLPLTVNSFTLGGTSDFTFNNATSFASPFTVTSNCTLGAGTLFTISSSQAVRVNGTFTNNAGAAGLVIKSDATGTGSLIEGSGVDATVERYMTTDVYHSFSPSISNATADMFHMMSYTGLDVYLYSHNEVNNADPYSGYFEIVPLNTPLIPMAGYAVYADGLNATPPVTDWVFYEVGTLNAGSFGSAGNMTRTGAGVFAGFNYIGNPYPSYINWDAGSGWTKTQMNATIWVENAGNWAIYTTPGPGVNGGSNIIGPGQGFFVEVNNAFGSGTITMNDNVRTSSSTPYLKNSVSNYVKLVASGNGKTDETVVRFDEGASPAYEGQSDGLKLAASDAAYPQIYTITDKALAYNCLPETETVEMGFSAGYDGIYTIGLADIADISAVWLEDKVTNQFTNLIAGTYSFGYTAGDAANRFVLHFKALSTPEITKDSKNIFAYDGKVYIQSEQNDEVAQIYNMAGQLISSTRLQAGLNQVEVYQTGNYIIKVVSPSGVATKKVFIN